MGTKTDLINQLNDNDLTLEEKLAAIDKLMNDEEAKKKYRQIKGLAPNAPVDPMDMLHCEGCQ